MEVVRCNTSPALAPVSARPAAPPAASGLDDTWGASVQLINDLKDNEDLKNFRTCLNAYAASEAVPPGVSESKAPSDTGLRQLNESGSSEFNKEGLEQIKAGIPPGAKLMIVDLREESHGMVNDRPVCWKGRRNWSNMGADLRPIIKDEQAKLASVAAGPSHPQVESEEQLCKEGGVDYLRLPVTDHLRPEDRDVDQLIGLVTTAPAGTWLHYHCKAGHGRTTTFMAMDDMIRNADKVSYDDIISRQHLIGGVDLKTDEAEDQEQGPWKRQVADERLDFLQSFYSYCAESKGDYSVPWTSWAAAHGIAAHGAPEAFIADNCGCK